MRVIIFIFLAFLLMGCAYRSPVQSEIDKMQTEAIASNTSSITMLRQILENIYSLNTLSNENVVGELKSVKEKGDDK